MRRRRHCRGRTGAWQRSLRNSASRFMEYRPLTVAPAAPRRAKSGSGWAVGGSLVILAAAVLLVFGN